MSTEPDSKPAPSIADLKLMAYKDMEIPTGLSSAEQTFYIKARLLYQARLEPEKGKREMAEIERAYLSDKQMDEMMFAISQLWKRIEPFAAEYAKSQSIDSANRFYAAVYGLPDDWRLKR